MTIPKRFFNTLQTCELHEGAMVVYQGVCPACTIQEDFDDFRKETAETMGDLIKQLDHLKEIA